MRKYEAPKMTAEAFDVEDVITASTVTPTPTAPYEPEQEPLPDVVVI